MSKQSHDPGVRKRRLIEERARREEDAESPEDLARSLVKRRLSSPQILTGRTRP